MAGLTADITCVGYCRVSTERQAGEQVTSLGDQAAAIEQLAARLKRRVAKWYRDEGASGATVEKRPALRALLADCAASPRDRRAPGLILVLNDSRFGRFPDPEEAAYWRVHLAKLGWHVRFCEGDESENTTARTVMRAIGGSLASEYREAIRRNSRRGRRGAAELGYWTTRAPYGYRRYVVFPPERARTLEASEYKAINEKVSLRPHAAESAEVAWLFERYATGEHSLQSLAFAFAARTGGDGALLAGHLRSISSNSVRGILKNPVYVGDIIGGRRGDPHDPSPRTVYERRDAHPAIVPRDVFAAVQARLGANKQATRAVAGQTLLSGLVRCPYCGSHFAGFGGGRESGRKYYGCTGGAARRPEQRVCPGLHGTVRRHLLDAAVLATLADVIETPAMQRAIAAAVSRYLARGSKPAAPDTAAWERETTKLTARRDRLVAKIADGVLSSEEAAGQLAEIRAGLARIAAARDSAAAVPIALDALRAIEDQLCRRAGDFRAHAASLSGVALRSLIRQWMPQATFDKVTRMLTIWIAPTDVLAGSDLRGWGWPAAGKAPVVRPLIRRVSLLQPGHDSLIEDRRAELSKARRVGGRA